MPRCREHVHASDSSACAPSAFSLAFSSPSDLSLSLSLSLSLRLGQSVCLFRLFSGPRKLPADRRAFETRVERASQRPGFGSVAVAAGGPALRRSSLSSGRVVVRRIASGGCIYAWRRDGSLGACAATCPSFMPAFNGVACPVQCSSASTVLPTPKTKQYALSLGTVLVVPLLLFTTAAYSSATPRM